MSKKLLHVITTFDRGGAENHLLSLVGGQIKHFAYHIDIVYLKGNGDLSQVAKEVGVNTIIGIDFQGIGVLKTIKLLTSLMEKNNYDLIHSHLLKANFIAGISAFLSKQNHVASKHNDEHQLAQNFIVRHIHKYSSRLFDKKIICLSKHVKEYMLRYGLQDKKMSLVYYAFDLNLYKNTSQCDIYTEFGIEKRNFIFGIVARITEQKGHLYLIDAFSEHLKQFPDSRLLVVGGSGYTDQYERMVKQKVLDLDLGKNVIFTGKREDAYSIIGQLNVFIMPSLWEGFGMVFLEAGSQAVPIISTNISAMPEVISGNGGILVEAKSSEAIEVAMEDIRTKYSEYKTKSVRYKEEITEKFGHKRMIEEIEQVYETI